MLKKRADDVEKCLNQVSEQLQNLQVKEKKSKQVEKLDDELQDKVTSIEKENTSLPKKVSQLKEVMEEK